MGRMDVNLMRYLEGEHFRVLIAVEMGMKNHEMVPLALVAAIARIHRGAVSKLLGDLVKHSLCAFERGSRYDGYRLTVRGYDFLALRALCTRGVVGSVGNQIGVGKESDVYVGGDANLEDLCLKFHRLGRTSFRKIKEKRDYHKNRKSASWLYLSRLAAQKEFAFLAALSSRGFPVPRPVDVCRHVVVMGLIDGRTLCHIDALEDPSALYHKLMSLIVKFASYGLIHGDFNEFNLMLLNDEKVVVIDFPQMISTDHPNAEFYFDRDVQCIRTFFKRKMDFDSDDFPRLSDVERRHNLDVELEASGFTKAMATDLNKAYDAGDFGAHLGGAGEDGEESEEDEEDEQTIKEEGEDIDQEEVALDNKRNMKTKRELELSSRFDSWLADASEQLGQVALEEGADEECPLLVHPRDIEPEEKERVRERETEREEEEEEEERGGEEEGEEQEEKKKKKIRKTATNSVTSHTSTIPPETIRRRVQMELRKNKGTQKLRAKGKQSAVSRGRKENRTTIGEYAGWDF